MIKTHIAHIIYRFSTGGLENGVVNLINRLPEDQYKHSIICITDHDKNFLNRIATNNVQVFDLNKPSGHNPLWLIKCWKLLRQLKPDLCHSRNLNPLEAQLSAFFAGVTYRIHGEHGWDINDLGGSNVKYQKLRRFLRPFIHQYIALSSEASEYLMHKIDVPKGKINQICNGVDINKFAVCNVEINLPKTFDIQGKIVFGTVGRLARVKNQTLLLEAFLSLWQKSPENKQNLRLVVVGDGELMPILTKMVKDAKADNAVWLTGLRDDVSDLMNIMDVFVLPSLAEGISNTLLEAMATGLPVIATNVGGNTDLVLPEHINSHIVEVGSPDKLACAMDIYINNPQKIISDSKLVREHCTESFSIESMVNKYHSLYQKNAN